MNVAGGGGGGGGGMFALGASGTEEERFMLDVPAVSPAGHWS